MAEEHGGAWTHAPGAFVLAVVFLICFALVYFLNWKYTFELWPMQ